MKIEKQVCNLKLAKKLKKLGVKQESLWYWVAGDVYLKEKADKVDRLIQPTSAFTVAELGEMLPQFIKTKTTHYSLHQYKERNVNFIKYVRTNQNWISGLPEMTHYDFVCSLPTESIIGTEANVRAKMIIYLRENKLLD